MSADTQIADATPRGDTTIPKLVEGAAQRWPSRAAYVFPDGTMTFGQVAAVTRAVGTQLWLDGVRPGDEVTVWYEHRRNGWPASTGPCQSEPWACC